MTNKDLFEMVQTYGGVIIRYQRVVVLKKVKNRFYYFLKFIPGINFKEKKESDYN